MATACDGALCPWEHPTLSIDLCAAVTFWAVRWGSIFSSPSCVPFAYSQIRSEIKV